MITHEEFNVISSLYDSLRTHLRKNGAVLGMSGFLALGVSDLGSLAITYYTTSQELKTSSSDPKIEDVNGDGTDDMILKVRLLETSFLPYYTLKDKVLIGVIEDGEIKYVPQELSDIE